VELEERMAIARWPYDESELRPGSYISGPRMFALGDSALWFATFTILGLEAMAGTSERSIRFLRPAKDGDLLARAVLSSVSDRRLVGTVEIWVDGAPDRLVAAAQGELRPPLIQAAPRLRIGRRRRTKIHEIELAHAQLSRMRGMTRYYHGRFFADTRLTAIGVIGLLVIGFWAVPEAFLMVPVVALLGANQTAFDASYLFMARRYASTLEEDINQAMRRRMLVGAELEDRYLVPLGSRRLVGVAFGRDFSWFGWMTVLYTSLGILAYVAGLWLGWDVLAGAGRAFYLAALGLVTLASVAVGWWWFVAGTGDERLAEVIENRFGARVENGRVGQPSRP
jgi:acyl-coenzyme A thioesterase PaaI-like protein